MVTPGEWQTWNEDAYKLARRYMKATRHLLSVAQIFGPLSKEAEDAHEDVARIEREIKRRNNYIARRTTAQQRRTRKYLPPT